MTLKTPEFWYDTEKKPNFILKLSAALYQVVSNRRIKKQPLYKSPLPVICIGNLTAGGTGKTPLVRYLRHSLTQNGYTPVVLTRGYGGRLDNIVLNADSLNRYSAKETGDEARLHANDGLTIIAKDRVKGALIAASETDADIIIMDDGFQNPYLHKDLSIIVVDGEIGFGNEFIIPAGPLREPVMEGLRRADTMVITGQADQKKIENTYGYLISCFKSKTIVRDSAPSKSKTYIAFAGLGRPEKFSETLKSNGYNIQELITFPDHHLYTSKELENLLNKSTELITTEKDWVRLPAEWRDKIIYLPIHYELNDEFTASIIQSLKDKK